MQPSASPPHRGPGRPRGAKNKQEPGGQAGWNLRYRQKKKQDEQEMDNNAEPPPRRRRGRPRKENPVPAYLDAINRNNESTSIGSDINDEMPEADLQQSLAGLMLSDN